MTPFNLIRVLLKLFAPGTTTGSTIVMYAGV